ncbi:DUF5057 domain-containing protein [Peribacillus tepidiphilus]|uniref:DUF5057 domain-containing protein n=1 Tax=Peribacillus tepidiphilus TaxID=2652445 RepID=UPI0035B50D76
MGGKIAKVLFSVMTAIVLLIQPCITFASNGSSDKIPNFSPELEVLEIIDQGSTSKLKPIIGDEGFHFTTMTMKRFVALRDELDGKYDLIAIMEGNYTSAGVNGKNHNTTNVMNDITNLRAQEIIRDFINKGQPVILDKKSIDTGTKLKSNFSKYLNDKNVMVYNSSGNNKQQELISNIKNFFNKNYIPRPRMKVKPIPNNQYVPGDTISFDFEVLQPADVSKRDLKARLYIDSDFNDRYEPSEIVLEANVTTKQNKVTYKLPKGYSGLRYWKLELVDTAQGLKDYAKGSFKFKDQEVHVKVLQVTRNVNDNSRLTRSTNMNQNFLSKPGEYNIQIDVTDIGTFNSSKHSEINGKYDMVIFGFADVYNNANINDNAVKSLKQFIASKQSIMFTHDTIFESNNNWVNNFMDATGQRPPKTDLGYGAPNKSNDTFRVNAGLMTEYPYLLADHVTIATTHNQYYTLDLEDPDVIPWYNIIGSNRDINDSWNHYYTYSKGNITYSGTGHTSSGFPEEEQKLFVNTMYRAFLGSNHAPTIELISPKENAVIPSNQKIELSYSIQDFDLKDKLLKTRVYLNGKQVYSQNEIPNGQVVTTSLDHKLTESGNVTVKIEAEDSSGAIGTKEFTVAVQKLDTSIEISRSSNAANPTKVGQNIVITYEVIPKEITGKVAEAINSDVLTVSGITYKEVFPKGLKVNAPAATGSVESGYVMEKQLSDITYRRVGNKFVAEPVRFEVVVIPQEKKNYLLNDSKISYRDFNGIQVNTTFNALTFVADIPLKGVNFPEAFVLNKGVAKNFSLDLSFDPQDAGIKEIVWTEDSGGEIIKLTDNTGAAEVVGEGSTFVHVKVTDVFGNEFTKRALVTVRIPVNDFTLQDLTLFIGETKTIPLQVDPEEARHSLELKIDRMDVVDLNTQNFTVTGLKAGEAYLTVSGTNAEGNKIEKTAKITVIEIPVEQINVTPSIVKLKKFDTFNSFHVDILPSNATNKEVVWTSLNQNVVRIIREGQIEAVGTGRAEVEVSTPDGKVKTKVDVYVGQPLTSIGVNPSMITLEKGQISHVNNYLKLNPSDATNVKSIDFNTNSNYYVEVDSTGKIYANRIGSQDIYIVATTEEGEVFSTVLTVKVVEEGKGSQGEDGSYLY